MISHRLFTEQFRPDTLEDIVLPNRIKNLFEQGLKQNILLYSGPGLGKTTSAKILTQGYATLYINASEETSVDIVRNEITDFCTTASLLDNNSMKAVILDEIDGASDQFFKALRGTIEKYAEFARFVVTCNYIEKVPEPILSRFNVINLDTENEEEEGEMRIKYYHRIVKILKDTKMAAEQDAIMKLGDTYFPDLRSMTTAIETLYLKGVKNIKVADIKAYDTQFEELYELLLTSDNPETNYKFLGENYVKKTDEVLIALGNDFIDYIRANNPKLINKIPDILITVADYQYKSKFTIDKFVNLLATAFHIQKILKS